MLLDLNKLHGEREHVERTFQPSAFDPQDDDYRVAAPVELSMDVEKDGRDVFRVTGRGQDDARSSTAAGASSRSRCRSTPRSSSAIVPHGRARAAETEREIAEDDLTTAFYRDGVARPRRAAARAVPARAADEAAVREDCRGLCPECGANLNRTDVRLHAAVGRSPAGGRSRAC